MKLISLTLARNSDWCIKPVLEHALRYCDQAVVMGHNCTDRTTEICQEFGEDKVSLITTDEDGWNEMWCRQGTLERGRVLGGTHFVILDDDEMLADTLVPSIRGLIEGLKPGEILQQPMRNCWRDLDHYRSDKGSPFSRTWKSVAFRDRPDLHWKPSGDYQHHHTHPYNSTPKRVAHRSGAGWLHFQHASWNRLVTKQTWYMAMELVKYGKVKANYRGTMDESGLELSPVPEDWWSPEAKSGIDLGRKPWQAADLQRMVAEHGGEFFVERGVPVAPGIDPWIMYSQNDEEHHILRHFDGKPPGRFYDIGAWDGKTFSNTLALLERGWSGVSVEPEPMSFLALMRHLEDHKDRVKFVNAAIATGGGLTRFWGSKGDAVSTLDPGHRDKWEGNIEGGMQEFYLKQLTPEELFGNFGPAEFINLDVEGTNMELFRLLPFDWPDLKLICVEYDGQADEMLAIAGKHGFRKLHMTGENMLLAR